MKDRIIEEVRRVRKKTVGGYANGWDTLAGHLVEKQKASPGKVVFHRAKRFADDDPA